MMCEIGLFLCGMLAGISLIFPIWVFLINPAHDDLVDKIIMRKSND